MPEENPEEKYCEFTIQINKRCGNWNWYSGEYRIVKQYVAEGILHGYFSKLFCIDTTYYCWQNCNIFKIIFLSNVLYQNLVTIKCFGAYKDSTSSCKSMQRLWLFNLRTFKCHKILCIDILILIMFLSSNICVISFNTRISIFLVLYIWEGIRIWSGVKRFEWKQIWFHSPVELFNNSI